MQHTHDVIIIGAGITGSAMALAVANLGLRVALLDKQIPTPVSHDLHLRVSNINLASEKFLNTLGVLFPENRRGVFKQITLFQENSLQSLNFSSSNLGLPYLGSIIENNVLVDLMHTALRTQHAINCFWPIKLEKIEISQIAASLHVEKIGILSAPLIIGAEGAHSWLREQSGILQQEKSYGQIALVAHIATQQPHAQVAYQRFLNTGPLAYLPLHDAKQCSIVWSSVPAHIEYLLELDDKAFGNEVAKALMHQLGVVELISARAKFPLVMRHAKQYIAPRLALVGDAIHTIHPLAGQGANLGLMDVASLARVIKRAKQQGRDPGSYAHLRQYERERRFANTGMLQAVGILAQNQQPFLSLRILGMNMMEHSTFIKRIMMQYAQGA